MSHHDLYQFLIDVLRRQANYRRDERFNLAEALGNDAISLGKLVLLATGQSIEETENEIGKQAGFSVQRQFRHLDKAQEIYDYARDTFKRLMDKYNEAFSSDFSISIDDIDRLLKFVEEKRLFIIPYAIFEIDEALNDPKRFRWTSLYAGLSNLATGFECFLREIANEGAVTIKAKPSTLFPIIKSLFDEWGKEFADEHTKRKDRLSEFEFIEDVYNSPSLDNILKAFLIAHKARNFAAHNYTLEPYFYRNLYSIAYMEICNSLFYSWKYASRRGWV